MRFRILGPLRVIVDHRPVALGGRRQRTLLALLLAHCRQLVPLDCLVDAVWDDHPPSTAERQIQNRVAALRRLLAVDRAGRPYIITDGAGYRLVPGPGELDAEVFADQVATATRVAGQGQAAQAVAELRSALGLWQGPAMFGLTGSAVEAAAAGLDEQRLAAIEQCLDLELMLGRHDLVVAEISELVAAHPLRERLVEQLVLAMHRAGRQADALASSEIE